MRQVPTRLAWGVRELVWKVDEKVVWPVSDAVTQDGVASATQLRPDEEVPRWRRYWPDLILAVALAVVAVLSRRHGLPTDGVWQDDAPPAAAALKAPLSQLIGVSKDSPGYIALLMGWKEVFTGGADALAWPAFIAGILGPPLLYLGLRALRFARSISFLLAAALVAAQPHIINSGRLKTYTIDLLVVLALAVILPRLARIRWTWLTAVAWYVGAMLVATISGFALGASLAAGVIVLLHRRSDFAVRAVAVGAQAAASVALYVDEARFYDGAKIESAFRESWDAFPDFHFNPISFADELLLHLRRLAEAFPGGPAWFGMLCGLIAVAGLVLACLPGQRAITARFLALVLGATVIGSLFGKVPFGPSQTSALNNGYRVSVWLFPVIAVGLAMVLQLVRRPLATRSPLRITFDVAAFAGAVVLLVSAGPAVRYPFPGSSSAAKYIDANLGQGDVAIIPFHTEWQFAAESRVPVKMALGPAGTYSFDPVGWSDPRIQYIGDVNRSDVAAVAKGANRVFIYYPALETGGLVPPEPQTRAQLTSMLSSLGFGVQNSVSYGDGNAAVDVLGHGPSAAQANLQQSDFPPGWTVTPSPSAGTGVFSCAGLSSRDATDSVVATHPHSLGSFSQLDQWPSKASASQSVAALRTPRGAACVRSPIALFLAASGRPQTVSVTPEPPPPGAGRRAAAYRVIVRDPAGSPTGAAGRILYFSRGRTSALMIGFGGERNKPFSRALLAKLAATLAQRMQSSP